MSLLIWKVIGSVREFPFKDKITSWETIDDWVTGRGEEEGSKCVSGSSMRCGLFYFKPSGQLLLMSLFRTAAKRINY